MGPDVTSWLHAPDGSNQGAGIGPREAPPRRRRQSQPPGPYGEELQHSPDFPKQNRVSRLSPQPPRTLESPLILAEHPALPLSGAPTSQPPHQAPPLSPSPLTFPFPQPPRLLPLCQPKFQLCFLAKSSFPKPTLEPRQPIAPPASDLWLYPPQTGSSHRQASAAAPTLGSVLGPFPSLPSWAPWPSKALWWFAGQGIPIAMHTFSPSPSHLLVAKLHFFGGSLNHPLFSSPRTSTIQEASGPIDVAAPDLGIQLPSW